MSAAAWWMLGITWGFVFMVSTYLFAKVYNRRS